MPVLEYNKLSLGAKNSTVSAFKTLIEESLGENTNSGVRSDSTLTQRYITEFDKSLYDKALSLPEAKTVSLKYLSNKSDLIYGVFTGENIYKDFNGTIDSSVKSAGNQIGWAILDHSSDLYCLFVNYGSNTSIIISISDFKVQPLVKDFTPLYDKLKQRKYEFDDSFIDDTHLNTSWVASLRDTISEIINEKDLPDSKSWDKLPTGELSLRDKLFNLWKFYMASYMTAGEISLLIQQIKNGDYNEDARSFNIFPVSNFIFNDNRKLNDMSKLGNVQVIIYDMPEYSGVIDKSKVNKIAKNMLVCFQQPESVSYTASSSYESVSPRGSQVPYQYYQNANQIEISFDLKWHIDELRAVSETVSLEDIERLAESFQRPWETDSGSLVPKVCGVILPGISRIGYISSVQITYTGSMTGEYDNAIMRIGSNAESRLDELSVNKFCTGYHYSELNASFSMILLEDVQLKKASDESEFTAINNIIKNTLSTAAAGKETEDALAMIQKVKNGAARAAELAGGLADATAQMIQSSKDFVDLLPDYGQSVSYSSITGRNITFSL